jgi:hypothetical protein
MMGEHAGMSRGATNRGVYLRIAAFLVLASAVGGANPLCTPKRFLKPTNECDVAPNLFTIHQFEPSGTADLPRVNGFALAEPQPSEIKVPASPPKRLPGRVLGIGALVLLGGGLVATAIWGARPYLRNLKLPSCPNCGTSDIRMSFPDHLLDRVFGLFSCSPYRCRVCYYRFYKRTPPDSDTDFVSPG